MNINFIPKGKHNELFLENYPPVLANKVQPDWYKNMRIVTKLEEFKHQMNPMKYDNINAKSCPAIQDILSDGFVIPLWADLYFATELDDNGNIIEQRWDFSARQAYLDDLNNHLGSHSKSQTVGMDLKKTIDGKVLKIDLPYYIEIPEGYSIYYSDPFYHFRNEIRCLSGIVEADKWGFISFPFEILKSDFVLKAGEPLIHCHIFKREDSKLKLNNLYLSEDEYNNKINKLRIHFVDNKPIKKILPTKKD